MAVTRDEDFAAEVGSFFGEYVGTFTSAHGQVRADLFQDQDQLVAHVSFAEGLSSDNVTDAYLSELKQYADTRGFGGRFRLVLSAA